MFVPLAKADAARRLVYGSIDETLDHAGEVMDYATAKPAFEAWSDKMYKASGGKSYGNIRAQHDLKKAAGRLDAISFDDDAKRISFVAHIVDDQDWAKVEAGVYTGFSPGGSYAKRWLDGSAYRYTPKVGELSIVDMPCIPTGTFTMVKADGAEEQVTFILDKAYEPGNDATKARAEDMAKAATGTSFKDHVVQARADLIAENATAELAKMAEVEPAAEPIADITAEPVAEVIDPVAVALAKADAALALAPAVEVHVGPFDDLAKAAAAVRLIAAPEGVDLAKALYTVSRLADLLDCFQGIVASTIYEANSEADGSAQPAKAAEAFKAMGELLCMMVQEEVAEAMTDLPELTPTVMIVDGEIEIMALATQIVDLVKADTELMEKAGKRNSKGDSAKIQSMHDNAVALGATCAAVAEKAFMAAENDRLAKAVDDTLPRINKLADAVETLTKAHDEALAKVAALEALPAAPKGIVMAVPREADNAGAETLAKSDDPYADIAAMPNGPAKQAAILARVGMNRPR